MSREILIVQGEDQAILDLLGTRVRKLRLQKGMSQEELANAVGYKDRSSINRIEKGKRDVNQNMIVALANALDTSPMYLLGYTSIESKEEYEQFRDVRNRINHVLNEDVWRLDDLYQILDFVTYLATNRNRSK